MHAEKYGSDFKNEIMSTAGTQINLEVISLGKVS